MIYSFSDEEWTLMERRLRALHPSIPEPRFTRIQNTLQTMRRDHKIHTRYQLNGVLLLLQARIPGDSEVEAGPGKTPCSQRTEAPDRGNELLRLSTLYDTLRYYRGIRRQQDADRRQERER